MIFKTPEQLVEFFNSLDLDKSTLVFKSTKVVEEVEEDCACKGQGPCQCPPEQPKLEESVKVQIAIPSSIIVESFSDDPSFDVEVTEGETNIFFVKDYKTVENACGTGELTLDDRVCFMNMCEMEGQAKINLNIVLENNKLRNVPFILEKTSGPTRLVLSKKYFGQSS